MSDRMLSRSFSRLKSIHDVITLMRGTEADRNGSRGWRHERCYGTDAMDLVRIR